MSITTGLRRSGAGLIFAAVAVFSVPGFAQEPTQAHLDAAREAIRALDATDQFDIILPSTAEQLKASLIQATPNLQKEINATVNAQALELASRRGDLEREAAAVYAKTFTQEELKGISEFYSSPAGQALLKKGPLVTRELLKAAEIWSNGISRDLATSVAKALYEKLGDLPTVGVPNAAGAPVEAPAE